MKQKDEFLDKLLSSEVKKAVDSMPSPDIERARTNIKKMLEIHIRRKYFAKRISTAVIIFFVFISGVLVGTSNTSIADIWFIKNIKSMFNDVLSIQTSTNINQAETFKEPETNMITEKEFLSIEKAETLIEYSIALPEYVPEEYNFYGVHIRSQGDNFSPIELRYSNKSNDYITITQIPLDTQLAISSNIRTNEASIETIQINNYEATIIVQESVTRLIWDDFRTQFIVEGTIGKEEIIKVGVSLNYQ